MDLNHFAKAIRDYQDVVSRETEAYEKKMLSAQQTLLASLNNFSAKVPQESPSISEVKGIYEDVVKLSRQDYEKLQEQLKLIEQVHPELSTKV